MVGEFSVLLGIFTTGLALGAATGVSCLSSCGPIYTPYLMQRGVDVKKSFMLLIELSIGRFIAYILFGVAVGLVGSTFKVFNKPMFMAVSYVLFSVILILSAFRTHRQNHGTCTSSKWETLSYSPLLLGIVTGINFCPSFLSATNYAISLGGVFAAVFLFIAFFFGTNIWLVPMAVFGDRKSVV